MNKSVKFRKIQIPSKINDIIKQFYYRISDNPDK